MNLANTFAQPNNVLCLNKEQIQHNDVLRSMLLDNSHADVAKTKTEVLLSFDSGIDVAKVKAQSDSLIKSILSPYILKVDIIGSLGSDKGFLMQYRHWLKLSDTCYLYRVTFRRNDIAYAYIDFELRQVKADEILFNQDLWILKGNFIYYPFTVRLLGISPSQSTQSVIPDRENQVSFPWDDQERVIYDLNHITRVICRYQDPALPQMFSVRISQGNTVQQGEVSPWYVYSTFTTEDDVYIAYGDYHYQYSHTYGTRLTKIDSFTSLLDI